MLKNVILYVRVSTDEQGEKNLSIPAQIEKLKKYCYLKQWNILAIFEERFSAWKTFERPQYSRMRKFIKENKRKVDYLLFTQWSRFSRDSGNAQNELRDLKRIGIEANAVEQWVDMSIPENLYMHSFYLAAPQVENDRLSLRVKDALRRGLKDGKWMGKAPFGYYNDKITKMVLPDSNTKDVVSFAFNMFSTGAYTIEEVRRKVTEKGFPLKKQHFINMLSNPFYSGKIYVKALGDEPEQLVKGLHSAIVEDHVFLSVQAILKGKRKPYIGKTKGEEIPLKGYLICPICRKPMTGSASKSRNGNRYHYYHCQRKYGCKNAYNALIANEEFESYLNTFKVNEEVLSLYYYILENVFNTNDQQREVERRAIEDKIQNIKKSIDALDKKMIANDLPIERYNRLVQSLEEERDILNARLDTLLKSSSEFSQYIDYSTALLADLAGYYKKAPLITKQKIIGSIFPEKLEFDGKKYRTTRINEVFEQICSIDKGFRKRKPGKNAGQSTYAPPVGLEPTTL